MNWLFGFVPYAEIPFSALIWGRDLVLPHLGMLDFIDSLKGGFMPSEEWIGDGKREVGDWRRGGWGKCS